MNFRRAIAMMACLIACGDSGNGSSPDASADQIAEDQTIGLNGLTHITLSPGGAALQTGASLPFSVTCIYSDFSTDACQRAGGLAWSSSRKTALTVSSTGVATWTTDPGAGNTDAGLVLVTAGGLNAEATVFGQHPGDTFYVYPTPDYRAVATSDGMTVVVGSTVTAGAGLVINDDASNGQPTGSPFNGSCTWTSSDSKIATVDVHGQVTGVAPGKVTINCVQSGNAVYGKSAVAGWISPGTTLDFVVIAGGSSNQTWYVRPNGGTPFTSTSPLGQCDGLANTDYPGTGTNQHCALSTIRYLWSDETTYQQQKWMIAGGDTVIVAPNPNGYNTGLDGPSPYQTPAGPTWLPTNCAGNSGCTMPAIPSGTATKHTRFLGANYASCHDDAQKTKLIVSYAAYAAFNVLDSQFVDIGCFEITDKSSCGGNGNFSNTCAHNDQNWGSLGIIQSALTSQVTYEDLFIHGLAGEAIHGAAGVGLKVDYVHMRAMPEAGFDMDDAPWNSSNISQAGGLTMTNSITEFSGCVEEYPVTHQYPYIECRDQNTGGYADGFGTGSTTGDWTFDHDIWRYNFQDGLDLLHTGMQSLVITDSQSYGNDGATYKIGAADSVIFRNNLGIANCQRILSTIGDEPASAIVPGVASCRASGDGTGFHFTDRGSYMFQFNTFVGYDATPYDFACEGGWDDCSHATAAYQNNIVLGYSNPAYNNGEPPALFYLSSDPSAMPPLEGWSIRDHNMYFGLRDGHCPTPAGVGETCSTDPLFVGEPASPIKAESDLDSFNFHLSSTSPAATAGVSIAGVTTDQEGDARTNPPSLGPLQIGAP